MSLTTVREHPVLGYALAVAATLATIGVLIPLRFLIEPLPAPPFLLTVMVVAWLAGFAPATVTVLLSGLALDYWFIPPIGAITSTSHEIASTLAFCAVGVGVAWLTATRRQAEDARQALLAQAQASSAAAEAANRAKDEFVAVLGHEFRNPLSAIVNAVDVLERTEAAAATVHAREVIGRQARNIGRMVDDLLEINRIANGKIRLDPEPLDLAETVRRCLATLAERTHGYRVSLDADTVWVNADPVRLEQIVVNLLDNALKYTPPGGAIDVRVWRQGSRAMLRVRDNGVGIAADVLPRIFDLFVQGDAPGVRGRRGLGIGLAVVRRLAELHGGTIDVESDGPGRGSAFTLRLPSTSAPPARSARTWRSMLPTPRRRVVVVEPDADLRSILCSLLQSSGHDVAEAADGPSALATAIRFGPDVMLIDVDLSGFDGYDLARRLRMTPEVKSARLIALTTYGRAEDAERALGAGFDHHASKPVDADALATMLR
jgi:two-component system, sensor histidine kinase